MGKLAHRAVLLAVGVLTTTLAVGSVVTPSLFAQSGSAISGRVTGMDTEADPPILTVTTDAGGAYVLRAPNRQSVVQVQVGSYFRANGVLSGSTFTATLLEVGGPGRRPPATPIPGGVTGRVTDLDTQSDPARVVIASESGDTLTILAPGRAPLARITIGSRVTAAGTRQGDTYRATDLMVLSGGHADETDNGDDNDNGDNDND